MSNTDIALTTDEMYQALLNRDRGYDGLFFFGVRTTGIFCRPICTAKRPLQRNVRFFNSAAEALAKGFRPCKRCHPLEPTGQMPLALARIVSTAEEDLRRRWTDADLRNHGVDPTGVRRWFQRNYGTTFHGYLRGRRLATAVHCLASGDDATRVAFAAGYRSVSGFREAFGQWFGVAPGSVREAGRLLIINRILTPLGPMIAAADDAALYLLEFADRRRLPGQLARLRQHLKCGFAPGDNALLEQVRTELDEYFAGARRQFNLSIACPGTPFQQVVWGQLQQIRYGETVTYESVAHVIGNARACRAVGRANAANRVAIVVPCHRVVRSDGKLSGYGAGVRRKEWLLHHERTDIAEAAAS